MESSSEFTKPVMDCNMPIHNQLKSDRLSLVLSYVHSKQPIPGLTQEWFRELSFSTLECGVHDKLHISSAEWWDLLLPDRRDQRLLVCLIRKTQRYTISNVESQVFSHHQANRVNRHTYTTTECAVISHVCLRLKRSSIVGTIVDAA